jgi:hypothetical protein
MNAPIVYVVRAVALTGRVWFHEFDSKSDALNKVREYKDTGGYIVTQSFYSKSLINQ